MLLLLQGADEFPLQLRKRIDFDAVVTVDGLSVVVVLQNHFP